MSATPGEGSAADGAVPTPACILLVGGGAREHALAWRLAGEPGVERVVVAPGNDAMAALPRVECRPDVRVTHGPEVAALATREAADLAVIGPEAPLAAGVADALASAGIAVFGPTAAAARIEASKSFCRAIAEEAGVRMARGAAFADARAAQAYATGLAAGGAGVVVKADGLMAGKGVRVCRDASEAAAAIAELTAAAASARETSAGDPVGTAGEAPIVVEARLVGPEASVIALCDGRVALALPAARDHKRLGDGDTGPNTGGMGAYAPLADLDDPAIAAIVAAFHAPVLAALARRGTPFRGALYAGLILTADGPVLLEFNARFGDPETQVLVPLLERPLAPLLAGAARGLLAETARAHGIAGPVLPSDVATAVGIVLASAGYPDAPRGGDAIAGLDAARDAGALVFHAATDRDASGTWRTRGGRALTVVGLGPEIAEARDVAEHAAALISFDGMQRRRDIAADPPLAPAAPVAASWTSLPVAT
jgi:phosphoribosylamine--glycine ligase